MHESGFHSHHHSFPSDFHLSPSHSPALSSDSPLASYVLQRQRARASPERGRPSLAHKPQVPLSALSPPSATLGAAGGHFNSTTKIKFVPLPALFSSCQARHRGVRSVGLHTSRFLPPSDSQQQTCSTISDSFVHLPSLDSRPRARLVQQEKVLRRTREFKGQSGVLPHRVERPFYMSGRRARIAGKEEVAPGDLEEMRRVRFDKNPTLFYGRGLSHGQLGSCGGGGGREAVRRFEVRINTALEQSRCFRLGGCVSVDSTHEAFKSAPEENEMTRDCVDSKQQTFITETRTRHDV